MCLLYSQKPRHLISDVREWMNEIPTVPTYYPVKPQPQCSYWAAMKKIFHQSGCCWFNPEELSYGHWTSRKIPWKRQMASQARQVIRTLILMWTCPPTMYMFLQGGKRIRSKKKKWMWQWKSEFLSQNTSKMGGKDWQGKQNLTAWQKIWFLPHGKF